MLGRQYDTQVCSVARALEVVGERWSLLVVRDAFMGVRRFDDFQRDLGISRNILSDRLATLVEHGIFERRRYQEHPERFEYRLTEKGLDLNPVLLELMRWGDRWAAPAHGPPVTVEHRDCGHETHAVQACSHCGGELTARNVRLHPGPGALTAVEPSQPTTDD